MSSKLVPANPEDVMVIRDLTPNVVTFSVPFMRHGVIPFGGRGTLVKLTSGALAIFSPVALTDASKAKVASLGNNLQYIIAPDLEHHIFLSEWSKAYPQAKIIGPEGLAARRTAAAAEGSDPRIGAEPFALEVTKAMKNAALESKTPLKLGVGDDFDADFDVEYVDAHPNLELVFLYKPDKVLIQADLLFNLPGEEQYSRVPEAERPKPNFLVRWFLTMQSTAGDAKPMKRWLWHVLTRRDREGYNESVRRIAGWEFDTVVPCHGETMVGDGKEVFEKCFEWHIKGGK